MNKSKFYLVKLYKQTYTAEECKEMASRGGANLANYFDWDYLVFGDAFETLEQAKEVMRQYKYADHCFNTASQSEHLTVYAACIEEWMKETDESGKVIDDYQTDIPETSEFGYITYVFDHDEDEDEDECGETYWKMIIRCADGTEEEGLII